MLSTVSIIPNVCCPARATNPLGLTCRVRTRAWRPRQRWCGKFSGIANSTLRTQRWGYYCYYCYYAWPTHAYYLTHFRRFGGTRGTCARALSIASQRKSLTPYHATCVMQSRWASQFAVNVSACAAADLLQNDCGRRWETSSAAASSGTTIPSGFLTPISTTTQ